MIRPWRLEILLQHRWIVFGSYSTEEKAKAAIPWARRSYWGVKETRIKARDGWQQ